MKRPSTDTTIAAISVLLWTYLLASSLYEKGRAERQPRPTPAPVTAQPEPVNYLEWRAPVGHQHVPEVRTVTF